ncbi:hypothetical protein TcYC6_0101610 [Trypanosoma cruzi]|nr:hypothetical protein TcYC6_0101610 [Trypanosoma cruzi]
MFREVLECVLEFVGSHSEQYGCSGKELLSFVSNDALPYHGLVDHASLRQMVLDLLLSESSEVSVKRDGNPVVPSELLNGTVPYEQCTFYPSMALQEKTLGVSLRFKNTRIAVNYACDNLVTGVRRFQNSAAGEDERRPSEGGLGGGIRRLLREQWLRVFYVCVDEGAPVVPYLFPHFATPPPPNQPKQHLRPLEAYLARRRGELQPPLIAIDPLVARQIVLSSPERRLVFEDAIHAIFAGHGHELPVMDGRRMYLALRRMLRAGGLRIAIAPIFIRKSKRNVRVVVANSSPDASDADDDDDDDDDNDGEDDDSNMSGASNSSDEDDNDADEGNDDSKEHGGGAAADLNVDAKRNNESFGIDPSYPLSLQLAKEAERRPLVMESVLPRVALYDLRATTNELLRFARQFEERWETIESTKVLSAHSKAFTRLLRPKGWGDDRHGSADKMSSVEGKELDLVKGVSSWAVNKVMEALRVAPLQALLLNDLLRIVNRRTLGRVIPFLRDKGLVATTGLSTPKGRRLGVVTIAGVELTAELRAKLMHSHLDGASVRVQKRKRSIALVKHLPDPKEGDEDDSASAAVATKPCPRSVRLVAKVTMVRNGYSRIGLFRLSRLHLELWRLWFALRQTPGTPMTVERVLQEMSFSSFCIIVGVADVDVGEYVGGRSMESCLWGTPIRRLPPSLQDRCRRSGVQPLLHSLAGLQSKGLLVCERSLVAYLDVPLAEVSIALVSTALDERRRRHIFCDGTDMTPQDTCRAVLNFWSESWTTAALTHEPFRAMELISEVVATEPNLSNAQLIALSRLLRIDPGILAEHVLQRQGVVRARKRTLRDVIQVEEYNKRRGEGHRASCTRRRIEVNGVTMAEALGAILQSEQPYFGLANLQRLVRGYSKELCSSRYDPQRKRVHGSIQTLIQVLMNVIERQQQSGMPPAVHSVMTSVLSPNFSLAPDDGEQRASEPEDGVPTGPDIQENSAMDASHGVPCEALQDVLRMILLTDEAHYDAIAAKALLAQFPEEEQLRCIDWLFKFPSFRTRSGGSGRIPRIELSPIFTFVPATLATTVTHCQSRASNFLQEITTSLLFTSPPNCQRWCVPPFAVTENTTGRDSLCQAPRLVEQPSMNLDSFAEEIREQKGLRVLRLPRFAWPSHPAAAPKTTLPPGVAAANATVIPEAVSAATSTRTKTEPYPARALLRPWRHLNHLELRDIPVDSAPSVEQVIMARSASATPKNEGLPLPRFPSIFHHVDGSFHEFVWRSFLFALYSLVHHFPGITKEQLVQRLKVSGLVSDASCHVALEFLKASLVIVARRVLVPCDGEVQSPFSRSGAACKYSECYFCTVSRDGPWRIMEL